MYSLSYYLMATHDNGFCAIVALKHALNKVAFVIRTPIGFFGVVWLHGMLAFHFNGNGKVGQWILIGTSGLLDVTRHVSCFWFPSTFQTEESVGSRYWKINYYASFKSRWVSQPIAFCVVNLKVKLKHVFPFRLWYTKNFSMHTWASSEYR